MKLNFKNTALQRTIKVRIVSKNGGDIILPVNSENPTLDLTNNILSMCLAAESNILECEGATSETKCIDFSEIGEYDLYIDDFVTPYKSNIVASDLVTFLHPKVESTVCEIIISCEGATENTSCIDFSSIGLFDVYINGILLEPLSNLTVEELVNLEHIELGIKDCTLPPISCEGAKDSTSCIEFLEDTFDVYINEVLILKSATAREIEEYEWTEIEANECFPEISCIDAIPNTDCIDFNTDYLYDVYIGDMETPYLSKITPLDILNLQHEFLEVSSCETESIEWLITSAVIEGSYIKLDAEGITSTTNESYSTFALTPLVDAVVNSFQEESNRNTQVFIETVNTVTGREDWIVDLENKQIKYTQVCETNTICPFSKYRYEHNNDNNVFFDPDKICTYLQTVHRFSGTDIRSYTILDEGVNGSVCQFTYVDQGQTYSDLKDGILRLNPSYDPNAGFLKSFKDIAEQLILDSEIKPSVADEYISRIVEETKSLRHVDSSNIHIQFEENKLKDL